MGSVCFNSTTFLSYDLSLESQGQNRLASCIGHQLFFGLLCRNHIRHTAQSQITTRSIGLRPALLARPANVTSTEVCCLNSGCFFILTLPETRLSCKLSVELPTRVLRSTSTLQSFLQLPLLGFSPFSRCGFDSPSSASRPCDRSRSRLQPDRHRHRVHEPLRPHLDLLLLSFSFRHVLCFSTLLLFSGASSGRTPLSSARHSFRSRRNLSLHLVLIRVSFFLGRVNPVSTASLFRSAPQI